MPIFVTTTQFTGLSNTYGKGPRSLSSIVRGLAQFQMRSVIVAAAIPALIDNTGSLVTDSLLSPVLSFTSAMLVGSDCTAKADIEAAFGTVIAALASVASQVNLTVAAVPAFAPLVSGLGVGGSPVGAVTRSFVGANAALAASAGSNVVLASVNGVLLELAYFVNILAVAAGVTPLVVGSVSPAFDGALPLPSTNTGATVAGVLSGAVKAVEASSVFTSLASNTHRLVTTINAVRAVTPVLNVIAA